MVGWAVAMTEGGTGTDPGCGADATFEPAPLVERGRELGVLAAGLDGLSSGRGRVVVVEAVAGQGKTALLDAARAAAAAHGVRVLWARARHLDTTAPYELLRRLLGPVVARLGGPGELAGAAAFAAPLFTPTTPVTAGVDYGCRWLLASLADREPLLVAVDDAHWADTESLLTLADLGADLDHQPIMMVVAARPEENPPGQAVLAKLATVETATVLAPAPLTTAGVRAVLRGAFGREPGDDFTRCCCRASGGNVFYLRELVRPLLAAGAAPDGVSAGDLDDTGPQALARTVRARLGELGSTAADLALAAAVLGDETPLGHAAAVAGLDPPEAGGQAARLVGAAILAAPEPMSFRHPLIRAAVAQTATPGLLGELHTRAAGVLRAAGAPAREVAQHLAAAPPRGQAQVCQLLLAEAQHDLDAGSVEVARRLLARALAEPPPQALRPQVLLTLAVAERATGDLLLARQHLEEVAASGPRPAAIAAMSDLLEVLCSLDDREAVRALHRQALASEPYGPSPEELRLRAVLLAHVAIGLATTRPRRLVAVDVERLPASSGEERHLLVCAAIFHRATWADSVGEFTGHLRRAVRDLPADRPLTYWEVHAALEAAAFLASVEAMDDADAVLRRIRPSVVRRSGVAPEQQAEWSNRTILNHVRRGQFEEALARLTPAEEFAERYGLTAYTRVASYARGCVAMERGDYREASRLLLQGPVEEGMIGVLGHLLAGRAERALADLARFQLPTEPGAPVREIEIQFDPHLIASHAHGLLGDRPAALAAAERELAVRRAHGPAPRLALALRRRATFAPTREAVRLLAEAVEVCADTPRLPVLARVRASFGAALRRDNRLVAARDELRVALDLADRLGMARLRARASAELRAAGGRPRRPRATGVAALTDSQLAVARLAAAGGTNRQIAEQLYVTVKTVETHLAAAYRKLGITGRDAIPQALAAAGALDDAPAAGG